MSCRGAMTVGELVELFLRDRQQAGLAVATVRFYRDRLARLVTMYGGREAGSLGLAEMQAVQAAAEVKSDGTAASDSTRAHTANALRILQAWAVEQEVIPKLWARRIPKPVIGERARILTDAETRAILTQRPRRPDFERIYNALRLSGARPGELCRATVEDLRADASSRWIELAEHKTGRKTGKPRVIPVGSKLGAIIDRAIGQRRTGPIFVNGKTGQAWTVEGLSDLFRRRRDKAGLAKELCLYLTRHEAGTRITKAAGVEQAGRCLGHVAGSRATARYVKLETQYLAACQDAEPGGPK